MAFNAGWSDMFGGTGYGRRRLDEEEDDGMPKPVSIDWSSFEKPGPASTRYRQLLENAPARPEVPKGDTIGAGLIGFAQNFSRTGKGEETYENLTQRPYHKMMEDFDRQAKAAHAGAALENQDRDDMAKVLMGRERAYDRDIGRYYEGERLKETRRAHDLEDVDRDAQREITKTDKIEDNKRNEKQLDISRGQLDVARGNLEQRKTEGLLDSFNKSVTSITKGLPKPKSTKGMTPGMQEKTDELALKRLVERHPDYYEDDGEGGKRIKSDISESGRHNLKVWREKYRKEIIDEWRNSSTDDEDIDEDF